MSRSTVEIVVALWCDERSSLPLQSRPISAWVYLSATAARGLRRRHRLGGHARYDLNLRVIEQVWGSDDEVHRAVARWAHG
jgi:hypothetical protein